jgi:DNA-binding transcriptional ArsR family regulator
MTYSLDFEKIGKAHQLLHTISLDSKRDVLRCLSDSTKTVKQISIELSKCHSSVSFDLGELRKVGAVDYTEKGIERWYRIVPETIERVINFTQKIN